MFNEIRLLREWIGAVSPDAPLYPLWGLIVRALHHAGLDALTAATTVSILAYALNIFLVFSIIRRVARMAVRRAESSAAFEEANYQDLEWLVASFGATTYALTPGFAMAAFSPSPLIFSQTPPILALYVLSFLMRAERLSSFVTSIFVTGVCMACSFVSGPIGLLPLPLVLLGLTVPFLRRRMLIATSLGISLFGFVFALSLIATVFERPLADLLRVVGVTAHMLPSGFAYPGSVVYFFFGFLPVVMAIVLVGTGRVRPMHLRIVFFTFWGVAVIFLGVGTIISALRGSGNPAEKFVDGIVEELGSRTVIVSDGLFDDLLAFRVPEDVLIVRLGPSERVPEELVKAVYDEDIRFSADLGTTAFVTEWLKRDPSAISRVLLVTTRSFETLIPESLVPCGWCWRGRADGEKSLAEQKGLWETRWASVRPQLEGRDKTSWTMRRLFAVQGMALADRLVKAGDAHLATQVKELVIRQMDPSFSREAVARRRSDREKLIASVKRLGELDGMEGAERSVRLMELEERILPDLERSVAPEVSWLIHVLRGELALKKGEEFRGEARDEYRVATMDELSDLNATAPKLLLLDAALRDDLAIERDSREVLRRDRSNRMALAMLGNALALKGDNDRAEAYLRRATAPGAGPVMIEPLNDLAEVLARRGELEEALAISERVLAAQPTSWNFMETRASILLRLGRADEAEAMLTAAQKAVREAKAMDVARTILDIDWARLMKLRGQTGIEYRQLVRSLSARQLSPAHRRLVDELQ